METKSLKKEDSIIVECNIEPYPRLMPEGMFEKMPDVKVRFDNGEEKTKFDFFPDEISFVPKEFIGLTEKQAFDLKFDKDKHFLQA